LVFLGGIAERNGVVAKNARLLITTLLAGAALAQSGGAGAAAADVPAAPNQADIAVKQRSTLGPQEMVQQGNDYFKSMNETVKRISSLQDQSKRQKDIIRLNCVTDKLVQAKVNMTIAEQAMAALQENIARADEGGRTHEFIRLTIVNQKVSVLGAEAENCIGEDLSFVGATRVDVEVDPNLPQIDVTSPPLPTLPIERPQDASPVKG
jgi:Neural proliferation differentiation control-1 protein (NPDC1)